MNSSSINSRNSATTSLIGRAPVRHWPAGRRGDARKSAESAARRLCRGFRFGRHARRRRSAQIRHGAKIVAVEASECPTLLRNGFGEHKIQGIGDKHIPLIHNIMNGDVVVGVSDESAGALDLLFNSEIGLAYLTGRRGVA